jgi:hypothetical protein
MRKKVNLQVKYGKGELRNLEMKRKSTVKELENLILEQKKNLKEKGAKARLRPLRLKINGLGADDDDILAIYDLKDGDIVKIKGPETTWWQRMVKLEIHCACFVAGVVMSMLLLKSLR